YADPAYPDGYANDDVPPQPMPPAPGYPALGAAPDAPPVAVGTQVAPPPGYAGAYPPAYSQPAQPAYPAPAPGYAQPVYPAGAYPAPAPVMVQPAPVYVGPPVGVSIGVGGGWRRGGWGVGLGF
ncbi:MAG: hypothetical protein LBH31_06045, partial [Burkholderiaceae bacterium]|nr:hypothetical protein [Burkholderiaceae bacterium]